jgi:hypothetical protein
MNQVPFWIVVYFTVGVPVLLATRWLVTTIERRRRTRFVNDLMGALKERKPKPKMQSRIREITKFALLIPIWPIASTAVIGDLFICTGCRLAMDPDQQSEFVSYGKLLRPVAVAEAERLETISDPCGERPAVPFGYLWASWRGFLKAGEPGAELWSFERTSDVDKATSPFNCNYSRGYAWVKDGKILHEFAVEGAPGRSLGA